MPKEEVIRGLELATKENLPQQALTSFNPNCDTFKSFKTCQFISRETIKETHKGIWQDFGEWKEKKKETIDTHEIAISDS